MVSWSAVARRIRVPLGFAFAFLYVWLAQPTPASLMEGLLLIIPGLLVRGLASGYLQKNEVLATGGPYAYTRNPLYVGSLILAGGFVLAARSWWIAAAAVVFFVIVYLPVIWSEESYLRQRFPEFASYADEVPRLFPRLSARPPGGGAFSWQLYWRHREYNAALGAGVLLAILMVKLRLVF